LRRYGEETSFVEIPNYDAYDDGEKQKQ